MRSLTFYCGKEFLFVSFIALCPFQQLGLNITIAVVAVDWDIKP